ncbi:MAG: hypothetical protein ABH971_02780 [bacterium]
MGSKEDRMIYSNFKDWMEGIGPSIRPFEEKEIENLVKFYLKIALNDHNDDMLTLDGTYEKVLWHINDNERPRYNIPSSDIIYNVMKNSYETSKKLYQKRWNNAIKEGGVKAFPSEEIWKVGEIEAKRIKRILKTKMEGSVTEQIEVAIEKLYEYNVFGPKEIEKTFGIQMTEVPRIPFAIEELEQARKLNQMLILRVSETADGKPLSLKAIKVIIEKRWQEANKGKLLFSDKWENFMGESYEKDAPRSGWALVSKKVIPESLNKNYIEQTEVIIDKLKEEVFKGMKLPNVYSEAIAEFESKKNELVRLMSEDWQKIVEPLSKLKITQLTRQTISEVIYDFTMYSDYDHWGCGRLLEDTYTWTASQSPNGYLVALGCSSVDGVKEDGWALPTIVTVIVAFVFLADHNFDFCFLNS